MITRDQAIEKLKADPINLEFEKTDGSIRVMSCTLKSDIVEQFNLMPDGPANPKKAVRKPNPEVCSVWDLEKNSWRSFRWDSVRWFDGENCPNGIK